MPHPTQLLPDELAHALFPAEWNVRVRQHEERTEIHATDADGRVAGFIQMRQDGSVMRLQSVILAPQHRRRGMFAAMASVSDIYRRHGIESIVVEGLSRDGAGAAMRHHLRGHCSGDHDLTVPVSELESLT